MKKEQIKYFTRAGDAGITIIGGKKISKADIRAEALGAIDELNSLLGIALSFAKFEYTKKILETIIDDLFTVGAELGRVGSKNLKQQKITTRHVAELENNINAIAKKIKPIRAFVLPIGTKGGAFLHFARALARRAERRVVALKKYRINPALLSYLNRLSSMLYVLARLENSRIKERTPSYRKL